MTNHSDEYYRWTENETCQVNTLFLMEPDCFRRFVQILKSFREVIRELDFQHFQRVEDQI